MDYSLAYRSHWSDEFPELPEPPQPSTRLTEKISDPYLTGIENYISAIATQVKNIQNQEVQVMTNFTQKLAKQKGKSKRDPEDAARAEFQLQLIGLRRKRREYRVMERRALDERIRYLDSMMQQKQDQEYLRYKLLKLKVIPDTPPNYAAGSFLDLSSIFIIAFQVAFIILMGTCVTYRDDALYNNGTPNRIDDYYSLYTHIALMIFFAWGFSGVWLRKYGFGALVFSLFIACEAMEWSFLGNGFFRNASNENYPKVELTMMTLIEATFCATSLVVALGAVLGKIGFYAGELLFFVLVGTLLWCVNYFVNIMVLKAVDNGGAMTVHLFGALYGLGATISLSSLWDKKDIDMRSDKHHDLTSNYSSDIWSIIGTIFLWVTFPSWNASLAPDTAQHRVAINTFLALTASCVVGYGLSRVFRKRSFEVRDLQTVTYVGGIALGSAHSLIISPAASLVIGGITAAVAMVFDTFALSYLERRTPENPVKIFDTRHILSFHAVPGFIGGVASIIAVVMNSSSKYGINTEDFIFARGIPRQAGFQTACLFISIGISLLTGLIVGRILHTVNEKVGRSQDPFTDENHFLVPTDFPRAPASVHSENATQ
eukprot:TRINITY_DN68_c0_g1_i2.p1 TRINITY_DN68_c0_g1~~TRINITY_DN68_c0_g1_i2.p1  ORF type:complete len:600 (-),score=132.17 TRINITY_DN68_c0_g1_i2:115-1914(-)